MGDFFEELEKRRKRKEIREKISKIREEIRFLDGMIDDYKAYRKDIDAKIQIWERQYEFYNHITLTPDIHVTDSFEGVSADYFAGGLPGIIQKINAAAGQMSGVTAGIWDQINKIEEYIEELNQKIELLNMELAALV